nr:hypothetical protein [Tanacetum cinerariifolium]
MVDSSKDKQSLGEDASKQERKIIDIDADEDITLVNDQDDAEMFDVSAVGEVNVASIATIDSAAATITTDEITLAEALVEINTSKPKAKGIILQKPKLVKQKKKDQVRHDEEVALKFLKRVGEKITQEGSKKQKVDDDKETTELKELMKIIPDEEEIATDAIHLAVKSPGIVDWKIHKKEIRAIIKS